MFMGWFVTDRQVIETGAQALKLISLFFVFWGLLYVFRGILNGAGNAGFALVSGILEVVGRMGCAFLLTSIPFIGQWESGWPRGSHGSLYPQPEPSAISAENGRRRN